MVCHNSSSLVTGEKLENTFLKTAEQNEKRFHLEGASRDKENSTNRSMFLPKQDEISEAHVSYATVALHKEAIPLLYAELQRFPEQELVGNI